MHIGMIGLGKMGYNMRARLRQGGIDVTGYDRNPDVTDVGSVDELLALLPDRKVLWIMVPSGAVTDAVVSELAGKLGEDDLVVDGGNTRFSDDIRHGTDLAKSGIRFVDCGVSGGVWGLENGYGLMAGGAPEDIEELLPLFDALRPEGTRSESFVHVGDIGAGHYAKMVHNGIEYGIMQAYAEGYELLAAKEIIKDVPGTFGAWQQGTVIRSWLLDLLVKALKEDPELKDIAGYVEDSGEGRWTVEEAIANAVPAPAITASVFARFASRQEDAPAMKMVAALRNQFGGHAVRRPGE
ncbi:MAG: decarboxylating 6-phosphogluconate dehydrogenase [Micrococcaceae bacterium]|uniref:phosphogluconate dehydrogenase (NAD(+)-dependent, decarboxylating) n=1 Tax=unclassified Arthrobacter TaxID=235627 RepID=UPI00265566AE|nr:decarboxylating 6-phosphogluconate dehydrogenase [Micrococcaceae bacterium]MDN5878645.1 decarboxylating 6-phosphogluconate dehydrogenase [Micrococcaceae bacterium]MDN5886129.1 decarboxylating 6-phosphogluconate dehydrogenase [Micrococcaceae bacterium]MDN5905445.1 decarboxylating 6-phosphogluconate dehydrogenase [Micrococcaceae bacterium]MDN6168779.1 decarboxylating 6-phosphogluconate dehydrogenase [Micrococcaceae bacterium]